MRFRVLMAALLVASFVSAAPAPAGDITVAAASDLQFAMKELAARYGKARPQTGIKTVFGSSGNIFAQIRSGAPFDLFFSADREYPDRLCREGLTAGESRIYAVGRIVLWTRKESGLDLSRGLDILLDPRVDKIALANPEHAPYGKRARESLARYGLWDKVKPKLVFGENVSQAAQFAQTGNASVGILALSLAVSPALKETGTYFLIDAGSHQPLAQAFVLLKRAAGNPEAQAFAAFLATPEARTILEAYGFAVP